MELYEIEFKEEAAKYIQIANHIKNLINSNVITDGQKLPTIRYLAEKLNVNKVTVVNSYKKLQNDGYAYQKIGSGTYAKKRETISRLKIEYNNELKKIKKDKNSSYIDFTGESSKETFFPMNDFKEIINTVLERDGAEALLSQETLGYTELRKTINKVFWSSTLNINNILIVSGAQQGIDIASKTILNINDNVVVENPTYGGALSVFKWRRANVFPVSITEDGIDLDEFEEILKKNRIKCFYTMSYFHNPTGISYSLEKKIRILELAEKYDFYIIEDDYLSELIFHKDIIHEPFKKMDTMNRVIYIRSFSKVFLPGIRLGYMVYPNMFKDMMTNSKVNTDSATSTLMQRSLELYIKEGYWKEHINNITNHYSNRYIKMKELIDKELLDFVNYVDPKGGLSFYFKIKNKEISSKELFYRLKNKGVFITPGCIFYNEKDEGLDSFKITFSQVSIEEIKEGIKAIKEEFKTWHMLP